jgi:hypothetical protein
MTAKSGHSGTRRTVLVVERGQLVSAAKLGAGILWIRRHRSPKPASAADTLNQAFLLVRHRGDR